MSRRNATACQRVTQSPPNALTLIAGADEETLDLILRFGPVDCKGRYLHWDQVRRRPPPAGLTTQQWWAGMWASRRTSSVPLPLEDTAGNVFRFSYVAQIQKTVHLIDLRFGRHILVDDRRAGRELTHHLVGSLFEEAITSSQLEGAATTRPVAKQLVRSGRRPRNHSEWMILNNYRAMQAAVELAESDGPLRPDDVLDLHRIVVRETLEDPEEAGRLQRPGDVRIAVYQADGRDDGTPLHSPPPAQELPERLERMCGFANSEPSDAEPELQDHFLPPLIRAIVLHFWLVYDHPFVDGNGRTARALFYWSILRSGYSLAPYISISSILGRAPAKYARSFQHVYTDNNDLTYFVVHQLNVLERAIQALERYVTRKRREVAELDTLLRDSSLLNYRQLVALSEAVRHLEPISIAAHAGRHRVTIQSARTDLLRLEELGLFGKFRVGRKYLFEPEPDLTARLRELTKRVGRATAAG